jgi:hypothetical protein
VANGRTVQPHRYGSDATKITLRFPGNFNKPASQTVSGKSSRRKIDLKLSRLLSLTLAVAGGAASSRVLQRRQQWEQRNNRIAI